MAWNKFYRWIPTPLVNTVTLNPSDKHTALRLGGNDLLVYSSDGKDGVVKSTHGHSYLSGKWYVEMEIIGDDLNTSMLGLGKLAMDNADYPGESDGSMGKYFTDILFDGDTKEYGASASQGDFVGLAVDMVNQKAFFSVNGVYDEASNPVTGADPAWEWTEETDMYVVVEPYEQDIVVSVNFGATPFNTDPPAGYLAWDINIWNT